MLKYWLSVKSYFHENVVLRFHNVTVVVPEYILNNIYKSMKNLFVN